MTFTDPASTTANQANREEADSRSVFVGNVRNRIISFFSPHTLVLISLCQLRVA